jgi:hypothetical protein
MRETGYYWVKRKGQWVIAQWSVGYLHVWNLFNSSRDFSDRDFDEIDEHRIERQRILSERELEAIASGRSLYEDEYKGFIAGYKYAKSVD